MNADVLFLQVCSGIYIASAAVAVEDSHNLLNSYPRHIQDLNINTLDVNLEAVPDMVELDEFKNPLNNVYRLYTRRNVTAAQTLKLNVNTSIYKSHFNPLVPTVVIAHGWLNNEDSGLNPVLRDAFLCKSDVNLIILNWSSLADTSYVAVSNKVITAGRALGEFLAYLSVLMGARLDSMHMVGFCLGAHLVGNAGRALGGNVARITGLDPAGPLWGLNSDALRSNDAIYVEIIHTDGGYNVGSLGIGFALGDADFFPNGGVSQPGCLTNICSHNRAWELFAATVTNNHLVGKYCTSTLQISLNDCKGAPLNMGNDDLSKIGDWQISREHSKNISVLSTMAERIHTIGTNASLKRQSHFCIRFYFNFKEEVPNIFNMTNVKPGQMPHFEPRNFKNY